MTQKNLVTPPYLFEHIIFFLLLVGLVLIFWNPIGLFSVNPKNGVLLFAYRGFTALFCWTVLLVLLALSHHAKKGIIDCFLSLSPWIRWLIVVFFSIGLLSATFKAYSAPTAFKGVAIDITMLITILFLASYFKRYPNAINWLIATVIICAISYLFAVLFNISLISYIDGNTSIAIAHKRLIIRQFNFSNPRFFDHFVSWFLPLLCLPLLSSTHQNIKQNLAKKPLRYRLPKCYCEAKMPTGNCFKALAFLAMISLWFAVIAHASRAFIVEYLVILIVLVIVNKKIAGRFFSYQFITIILGALLFYSVNISLGLDNVLQRDVFDNQDRWLLWEKTLLIGLNHPLLGVGELNLLYYLNNYPHNILLAVFAQWGVIGLAIFLLVCLRSFRYGWYLAKKYRDLASYLMAFSCVLAGMTHALVSNLFRLQLSQYSLVFVIGLLLSFMPQERHSIAKYWHSILTLLLLASLLVLAVVPYFYIVAF